MSVLLTSAGLETEAITKYFKSQFNKEMAFVKALFIPTAAINTGAIEVLPKCVNDLLKCGIRDENIKVFDLHKGMEIDELKQYDVVYLCGGTTQYLLERINATKFNQSLMAYINLDGFVVGVSAGSLIFANQIEGNLGLIDTKLEVHCEVGEKTGKLEKPLKEKIRLTNTSALVIENVSGELKIIGR